MRRVIENVLGLFFGVGVAASLFGPQLESAISPILVGPRLDDGKYLKDPVVSNVRWIGSGEGARLWWTVDFCKLEPAILTAASYTFYLIRDPQAPGVPLVVTNETRKVPVGDTPLPSKCLRIDYSAELPDDPPPEPGDYILSRAIYQSPHGFWWSIADDFGTVTILSSPPS